MRPGEAPEAIRKVVENTVRETNHRAMQKAFRVSNAMRNSVIEVLTNDSPSAPGTPPGVRSGYLRRAWKTGVRNIGGRGNGVAIAAFADAKAPYAGYLQDGTKNRDGTIRMEARPFVEPILEDVDPEVQSIFSDF